MAAAKLSADNSSSGEPQGRRASFDTSKRFSTGQVVPVTEFQ